MIKQTNHQPGCRGHIALVTALILAGATLGFTRLSNQKDSKAPEVHLVVDQSPLQRDAKTHTSFASVIKSVAPSVVQVNVASKIKISSDQLPMNEPFFRRFFGDPFDESQLPKNRPTPKQHGVGSGVITSKDGYILTNHHVVDNADEVKITLNHGREYKAKLIGTDPKTDIAVLKIDAKDLPFLVLAI